MKDTLNKRFWWRIARMALYRSRTYEPDRYYKIYQYCIKRSIIAKL